MNECTINEQRFTRRPFRFPACLPVSLSPFPCLMTGGGRGAGAEVHRDQDLPGSTGGQGCQGGYALC